MNNDFDNLKDLVKRHGLVSVVKMLSQTSSFERGRPSAEEKARRGAEKKLRETLAKLGG